jgi:vancomycin resistance protein YoaR
MHGRATEPHERGSAWTSLLLGLGLTTTLLLMVCGLAVLGYGRRYAERILPGITIQGVPVGGLLRKEALARLEQALVVQELPYLTLRGPEGEWIYSTAHLGGYLAFEPAVREAWQLGRSGLFREDMATRIRLLWLGYNIVPTFHLEPGLALTPLRQIARQAGRPPQQAQVWVAGMQVRSDASQTGRDLDIAASQEAIVVAVRAALGASGWSREPLWLRARYNRPPSTGHFPVETIPVELVFYEVALPLAEVSEARQQAEIILSAPVTLSYEHPILGQGALATERRAWSIDRAQLSAWLRVGLPEEQAGGAPQVALDEAALRAFVEGLAQEIERPARQGRYRYDPATAALSVREVEQYGLTLDVEAALDALIAACLSPEERHVALPVQVIAPDVTLAQIEALLPLELVSEGETGFAGSTDARLHNIEVATAMFEGLAIAPHARFSMVEHLGLVTLANGYSESWVIYGNQTLLGPGGGVCQVATTLFRAAFWGGYPIIERTPHSYRVSWYEPPVGLDAAVFTPWVDVKFDNDTATPLLILTEVDRANSKLYFRLYGRSVGRTVRIEGPTLGPAIPPGPDIIETDPTLAPGERVLIERARDGVQVTVYRLIEVNGQQVARERFFSDYQPWPARYREGPAPAGEADTQSGG